MPLAGFRGTQVHSESQLQRRDQGGLHESEGLPVPPQALRAEGPARDHLDGAEEVRLHRHPHSAQGIPHPCVSCPLYLFFYYYYYYYFFFFFFVT